MDTSTATLPKLLWLSDRPAPAVVAEAVAGRWQLEPYRPDEPLSEQMDEASVALVMPSGDAASLDGLLESLDRAGAVAIFILSDAAEELRAVLGLRDGPFLWVPEDASAVELAAEIAAAHRLCPTIRRLRGELSAGEQISSDLDEELRLAANLQRDFLPTDPPEVGPVRFAALLLPAGFVSGDIYDIVRLDETTVGFYVADAVGHGLPAALLTMFIKKALQTKRITGNTYEIIPPEVAMAGLNADICQQNLSGFHFCTAAYGVLETSSLTLTYACAGHPEPVLLRAGGAVETLAAPGGLLGVMPDEAYEARTVRLAAGDRLVFYTDGLEAAFRRADGTRPEMYDALRPFTDADRDEMLSDLAESIRRSRARRRLDLDDATVILADVER
jgi:serine phosphatase RsbU (regulator of sigma subunit)